MELDQNIDLAAPPTHPLDEMDNTIPWASFKMGEWGIYTQDNISLRMWSQAKRQGCLYQQS